jgi:hypothetical protein
MSVVAKCFSLNLKCNNNLNLIKSLEKATYDYRDKILLSSSI